MNKNIEYYLVLPESATVRSSAIETLSFLNRDRYRFSRDQSGREEDRFYLDKKEVTIGTKLENGMILGILELCTSVSERHGIFTRERESGGEVYFFEDLGSEKGTKINGVELPKVDPRRKLSDGDRITLGNRISFIYRIEIRRP